MIDGLVQWTVGLRGWQRLISAFLIGAFATLALPPFHAIPVLWIALPLLLWLLEGCSSWRSAAATGWAFGFGHFLVGLSWIANAFYVDEVTFGAFAIPAVVGLTFALGIFFALVCAAAYTVPLPSADAMPYERVTRMGARALMFAAAWTVQEWTRGWILTGFPWNPMATIWAERATPLGDAMIQSVSVIGTYGLSLLTVAAAAMPAVLGPRPRWREAWLWTAAPLGVLIVVGALGAARLAVTPTTYVPNVNLRLVQPNIPQADKWKNELRETHLRDYVAMSILDRPANTTAVIWGEAAIAYFLDRDTGARALAALAVPTDGVLITGADRAESRDAIFNSLFVIAPDASIKAFYDKHHLVPFGEYLPLRGLMPFEALATSGDFAAGAGLVTLAPPSLPPFSPLICYEIIFPGRVTASDGSRPQWLLNLTNDSWFGGHTGPYQHFATARLRAVEEGLPLVRTAATGISAVVDSQGRVTKSLGLNQRGVIDAALPAALEFTIFRNLGNALPLLIALATALLVRRSYK